MDEIDVSIETEVNPTEDIDKVKKAVESIFGDVTFAVKPKQRGCTLVGETKSLAGLERLQNLLRSERIRDAARRALLGAMNERSIIFYLNKQVASVSHISFSRPEGESPLGPLKVQIQCDDPRELVDWLSPKTERS